MSDILDLLDAKLADHRERGEPTAVAFHLAPDVAEKACEAMLSLSRQERVERGVTIERGRLGYRGLPAIPHALPDGWVLILGDSPMTRTLGGLGETDRDPVRRAQREAFFIKHVIGRDAARRR